MRAYRAITMYQTADLKTHTSENKAQEHVDNLLAEEIQKILRESKVADKCVLTASDQFSLTQGIMERKGSLYAALSLSFAFDDEWELY